MGALPSNKSTNEKKPPFQKVRITNIFYDSKKSCNQKMAIEFPQKLNRSIIGWRIAPQSTTKVSNLIF
jgi:hypothetical protein